MNSEDSDQGTSLFSGIVMAVAGVGLVGAVLLILFNAESRVDDEPLQASLIYLQAITRIVAFGGIAFGAYLIAKAMK